MFLKLNYNCRISENCTDCILVCDYLRAGKPFKIFKLLIKKTFMGQKINFKMTIKGTIHNGTL